MRVCFYYAFATPRAAKPFPRVPGLCCSSVVHVLLATYRNFPVAATSGVLLYSCTISDGTEDRTAATP